MEEENDKLVYDPVIERDIEETNRLVGVQQALEAQEQGQAPAAPGAETQQQPQQQQQEPQEQEEGFNLGDSVQDTLKQGLLPTLATIDFVTDLGRYVGLQGVDDWWDKNSPQFKSPLLKGARGMAKEIIPNILLFLATKGAIKKTGIGANVGPKTNLAANLALEAGIDMGVSGAIQETSTDENISNWAEDTFGIRGLPFAIRDGDSPDTIWEKNMSVNAGFVGLASGLGAFFGAKGLGRVTKLKNGDEIIETADDITADALEAQNKIEKAQTAEARQRLAADPEGQNGYDAFINEPAEPQARVIQGTDADPRMAMNDQARIQQGLGTTDGLQRSILTPEQRKIYAAADGSQRAKILDEVSNQFNQVDEISTSAATLKSEDFQAAIDNLADQALRASGNIEGLGTLKQTIDDLKTSTYDILGTGQGVRYSSEAGQQVLTGAVNKLLDVYLDPEKLRTSVMIQQSSATDVVTASSTVNRLDDAVDTTRQQELVWEALGIILREDRLNRKISGFALNLKKMMKATSDPKIKTEILNKAAKDFDVNMNEATQSVSEFVQTYKTIAQQNPEFLKPFYQLYDLTNGDVDTLAKMAKWADGKLSITKAFVNLDPSVQSYVAQNLRSIRYNSVLSGLSAVRAAAGNAIQLVAKPISTLAGSAARGDANSFRRAVVGYGGFTENFKRGLKQMGDSWRYALRNPDLAGRADTLGVEKRLDEFEILDNIAEGWRANGETAKVGWWNATKAVSWFNNTSFSRYGVNAMYAIDGFTQSFVASGFSRMKAYDEVFEMTGGKWDQALFDQKQKALYDKVFDKDGLITDEAVKFASSEIALNLDNKGVEVLQGMFKYAPITESIFMFPRTGLNALELGWTFNPASALGLSFGRQRKVFKAVNKAEKIEALAEHGIKEYSDEAFNMLKSEYRGRQIMGSTVVMATALMAFEGNITGNGPADYGEKQRMINLGWKPLSIKTPFGWVSYKGVEPFDSLLGLTADVIYEGTRKDAAFADEWFGKISFAIGANISNKTFLSGFEPLVSMASGDEGAINRFIANYVNSAVPLAGARSVLSRIVTPQLKDIKNDWRQYLANQNKFAFNNNDYLQDSLDVFTNKPINYTEGIISVANGLLPFFKTNGGTEPWRQWLIDTGWDDLQTFRTDPLTGKTLEPSERQFVNNWIAENVDLIGQIERLMNNKELNEELAEYKRQLGFAQPQDEFPIKQLRVHKELNKMMDKAFRLAWKAYKLENRNAAEIERNKDLIERQLNRGLVKEAGATNERLVDLLNNPNK